VPGTPISPPPQPAMRRRITVAYVLAAVLVGLIGVSAVYNATQFLDSAARVDHTYAMLAELEAVGAAIKDIETGSRGFVITGDDAYLEPYRVATALVPQKLERLRQLTKDNPAQQRRLEQLDTLVAAKMQHAKEVVAARAAGGRDAGVAAVVSGTGKRTMDAIRTLVAEMQAEARQLLAERREAEQRSAGRSRQSLAVVTATILILLAVIAIMVRRDLGLRERAHAALQAAHAVLDHRVDERTAELAQSNRLLQQESAERQLALEALRDSEAFTSAIVTNAVDGIVTIDAHGVIHTFNPAAERLFGYGAAEVVGRNVTMLMPPPHRTDHDNYLATYLHTGERKIIGIGREVSAQRKDGTTVPIELSVSELGFGDRRLFAGTIRDLTERKRAAAELEALQQVARQRERLADVGAITAQIVHDVGNPLAGMSMQAQLALRRAQRNPTRPVSAVIPAIERILSEVRRLDTLIKGFMDFSREQRLTVTPVELRRFLTDLAELWRPVAAARHISLALDVADGLPHLQADAEKLRRVLDNLVKNAIEAIHDGPGRVDVQATLLNPSTVRIVVRDTGPGIPSTVEVFRLFTTTKAQGSGIGLAVARQIVQAHGGTIECAADAPRGTVFRIDLPLNRAAA